jgi:hypothetical protein
MVEAEARAEAAGDEDHGDLAGAEQLGSFGAGLSGREIGAAAVKSHRGGRLGASGKGRPVGPFVTRCVFAFTMLRLQLAKQVPIDLIDLAGEFFTLLVVKAIPKGDQMLLADWR